MAFFDFLNTRATRREGVLPSSPNIATVFGFPVHDDFAFIQLSAVFRSIEIISDSVAVLPITSEKNQTLFDYNIERGISTYQWLKLIVRNIIISGNAFTYVKFNEKGKPEKLLYLKPEDVVINYDEITGRLNYQVVNHKGLSIVYPENMLHFRKITKDGVEGRSIFGYAARALNLTKEMEEAAKDYFDTNNFRGFLTTEYELEPEKQKEIEANFSFFLKNRSAAVLSGGLDFKQLQMDTAKDAEMIESRDYQLGEIARFFGIPVELLKGTTTHNSLEQSQQEFFERTLQSYVILIEEELRRKLFDKSINLDENAMMRMAKKDQAEYLNKLVMGGILNINEAREELGYSAIEGGDKNIIAYTSVEDNKV